MNAAAVATVTPEDAALSDVPQERLRGVKSVDVMGGPAELPSPHLLVLAHRDYLRVVADDVEVEHLVGVALVGLDERALFGIPQPRRAVSAGGGRDGNRK